MKSKKGLIITVAVVGILLVLLVVVPYLIDVDNYRPTIESALRSSIGRQVQIGHLRFSLATRALTAEEISISDDEAFSRSLFLQAKSLEVGVEALPLLFSRELHINSLTLKEPQLTLLRLPSGKWNFSSLGAKEKAGKTAQVPASGGGSTLSGFSMQHLKITNGRLTVGRSPSGGALQSYEDVNLEADHLSSSAAFPLKFSAKTPGGGKLKLEGTAGPIDPNGTIEHAVVHLNFNGQKLPVQDVQGLLQILGVALPSGSSLHGGIVTANLAVDGPLNRLVSNGPISVSNVTFSGFSLASKLGALASVGGLQGGSDTLIQSMNSKLRVAPDGTRAEDLSIVIPALGALTGAGTVSPTNSLNFRMLAKLNPGVGGALGGLGKIAGLGQGNNELPFRIQGTTSNPVFLPDVSSALGGNLATPSQGALEQILGGLTGKKKP
jgi:hypothetical protein